MGSAKDHIQSDPTTITVWAIGLRETLLKRARMSVSSLNLPSSPANHPCKTFVIPNFYFITGVGARANWGWEPSHCELPSGLPNSNCKGEGSHPSGSFDHNRMCCGIYGAMESCIGPE